MEIISKKSREKAYTRGDFEISLTIDESHIFFEACNQKTDTIYTASLSNKTVEEATQFLFSNIDDLFDLLTKALDTKSNSKPSGIYVKFNKKEVYFFIKVEFVSPIRKTSSFYLYLKPQGLGAPTKKIHYQIEELNKKVLKLEGLIENSGFPSNFSEKLKKLESFLEQNSENTNIFFSKPTVILNSNSTRDINGTTKSIIEPQVLSLKTVSFDPKISMKYFKFKDNNAKISRTVVDKKQHMLAWGNFPLNKKSLQTQIFTIKITKLNPEFERINSCVGIMTNDGFNKLDNLADHSGEGCYLYGLNTQFLWINDIKRQVNHKFGKVNDLIRISVSFSKKKIVWEANDVEVGFGELEIEQIEKLEFYPVVTLAFNKETVSISGITLE